IVCTIQKLGLALDETSRRNKQREKNRQSSYKDMLEPLRDKRLVFIFDECHRSQFGENHQAIKEFFPKAQLFGFTGTPIFEQNATVRQITGDEQNLRTTNDLFERPLHEYTITHAIEDGNVLRFHIDYFTPSKKNAPKPGERLAKTAVVSAILDKHDAATGGRRFNALMATASINDAIEYFGLFEAAQAERRQADPEFVPLNIAVVFSPPADVSPDVRQIQEDLPQEREDNRQDPEEKKKALTAIIADYNERFGTNHSINEFDIYYQDVQKRIKDQQFPNADLPKKGREKIDITIVVDMLLTGFDSKYLNTLYVDKNLKYHGLIQAFSRTNRVLNATKPYGHILDFRNQRAAVDEAIALFSGAQADAAREIWLVDKAPTVIEKLTSQVRALGEFMKSQGLDAKPEAVPNLKGDDARATFIKQFKEVQRLQTQLDQYTDLTEQEKTIIEQVLPKEQLRAFRGQYLETAQRLREQRERPAGEEQRAASDEVSQLDFEFVLFASALIDYDYIMGLIVRFTEQDPKKQKMTREQVIGLIESDAKFVDEREAITEYVRSLEAGKPLDENGVRDGYQQFKAQREGEEVATVAQKHGLVAETLQVFVDRILQPPMIFNAEQLNDLLAPLDLGWRARTEKELALMADLVPLLKKRATGREISGLSAYEG
ncbi:MAG TPA: DEAD/DEAH box helicase family protein, partial [Fimbriimonas sp.]|nr:DEAD/DEAH box helicase family protein [Fimbriimonas sp.]